MLRIGLSGGIGSGKSTVARRFVEHGAALIDADHLSREVVAPGTEGLAEIVGRFGSDVLDAEGNLDRPTMARRVFGDDRARAELNSIVHPRVGARTAELMAEVPADGILVHDIPLLVEAGYGANYHLVLIVDAPVVDRVRRLTARGLTEADARARIDAQASERERLAAADVWLDNSGSPERVLRAADRLWSRRLVPFEANVRLRRHVQRAVRVVDYDPDWPDVAARLISRIELASGDRALRVDHIGSTAVAGLAGRDSIDVQITVGSMADIEALAEPLADAGFPAAAETRGDPTNPIEPEPGQWANRVHASADPGQDANVHVRLAGSAGWRYALLLRDWLQADSAQRVGYSELKQAAAHRHVSGGQHHAYGAEKQAWLARAVPKADAWAARSGWSPPQV